MEYFRIYIVKLIKNNISETNTSNEFVDPGGLGVIILASGSEFRGFDPDRGRWIFSERKNSEYDFLQKGSKAAGPMS